MPDAPTAATGGPAPVPVDAGRARPVSAQLGLARPSLRPRRRLVRPIPYWALVLTVAVVPAVVVSRLASGAQSARARWGAGVPTVVVLADIAAGEPIGESDVEVRDLPAAARPASAMGSLPAGAVARVDLVAGEPVVAARLAPAGASPTSARLPAGTRGIAVAYDRGLPLWIGDRVDVLVTVDADTARPTLTLARAAPVVAVGDDAVTLAIAAEDAERVAFGLAAGIVALSLNGPLSPAR